MINTNDCVPSGTPLHDIDGEVLSPSHVKSGGIEAPFSKSVLVSFKVSDIDVEDELVMSEVVGASAGLAPMNHAPIIITSAPTPTKTRAFRILEIIPSLDILASIPR